MLLIYAFVLSSFLILGINSQLTGTWPTPDTPPPYSSEWDNLVDFSQVPDIPVQTAAGANCPAGDPYCDWTCTKCARTNTTDIIQCPSNKDWGISFDDGPTIYTPPLLDYLDSSGYKITFFVIGSRVYQNPTILQREVSSGHQIGVHTWSHTALTTQNNTEIIAEIKWTEAAIWEAVGMKPTYMRPPYGDVDDRVRAILAQLGYKIVIWDLDTNDWYSGSEPSFQMSWVEGNFTEWVATPSSTGHISLEHDLYNQTAAQGPLVMPIVHNAGYNIKPVYQCVGDTSFYITNSTNSTNSSSSTPGSINLSNSNSSTSSSAPASTSKTSNSISHKNNNSLLLALGLFILSYFII